MKIVIDVLGKPAAKQGLRFYRGRPVGVGGTNKALVAWRKAVMRAIVEEIARGDGEIAAMAEATRVTVEITFRLEGAEPGQPHTSPPDLDNLAKGTLDALTEAGVLGDDAYVHDLRVRKVGAKPGNEGARIVMDDGQ
jgi:Holliday junction resolvase RusA-like endonuclease